MENNTNNTEEVSNADSFMEEVQTYLTFKIASYIAFYWMPILIPIGFLGNTLSFLVMIKPSNRKMSTCIYMAAISVNDNIMMILVLYAWLVTVVKVHEVHPMECTLVGYLTFIAMQNSTIQVLAMTFDKYIAIRWPHKAAIHSTPRRAKRTISGVTSCVCIYNIPHLFFTKMVGDVCIGYAVGGTITQIYSWMSFVLNAVISFVLLIYMNCVIIKRVRSSHKMFGGTEGQGELKDQGKSRQNKMKNTENQLTVMLLLVTTLFLILMIPTYIRFLYTTFVTRDTPPKYASLMLFYHVSQKLYNTNNGINFFLYCISGQKFRNDLKEILLCRGADKRSGTIKYNSSLTDISAVS